MIKRLLLLSLLFMSLISHIAYSHEGCEWQHWQAYWNRFVQADGRVIDYGEGQEATYSEAQAYTLFFALVANDRDRFATLLHWTNKELANGELGKHLPAWKWGRLENGQWGVIDPNAASDADMWLAYVLLEAGRLWKTPEYTQMGLQLLKTIAAEEVITLPDGRKNILPGPQGFVSDNISWRFNPSYFPLQLLRRFASADPAGPWQEITTNAIEMMTATSPHGLAADWVDYRTHYGWVPDLKSGAIGSYDAIRVYLWLGMLPQGEPFKVKLQDNYRGMASFMNKHEGLPPKRINTLNGEYESDPPAGFSGALIPYLNALKEQDLLEQQVKRLEVSEADGLVGKPPRYYDQVLTLFGRGWQEQRFAFGKDGELLPRWKTCSPAH